MTKIMPCLWFDDRIDDAIKPGFDHVVHGVAATTANTEHGDAGLQFLNVRDGEVDSHGRPHSGGVGKDLPSQTLTGP